ncbi:MAG: cytochrome oxidase subunit III [Alphaproteobacteria bacterium]|nr:cytochrome oxidase subunit III [Alphaproteobacteria bacterium]MDP6566082.1 cytochrome oxidase subunit III [Alphaproteobacteria bacterium]MDP6812908.1 cytochrome oxidase subunit III [Alphaproteobacteria bacterium]
MDEERHRKFVLLGWGLFVVSALFFILASLRSGDWLGLAGGLFFLLACIAFLVPLLARSQD